jgi:hypothetical protein
VYDAAIVVGRTHKLTVSVEPDGVAATIRVAGEVVKGDTITITDSHGYASVAVTAPGYFPWRQLVELHGEIVTVHVSLQPLPSKRRKPMPWVLMAMVIFALVKMVLSC